MNARRGPDLARALRLAPTFEKAVRGVSRMLSDAGIRHALVGALGANAYRSRPRTTEDIDFLVGDEAFERRPGGIVMLRVPVLEFDGIDIDQVPVTSGLPIMENAVAHPLLADGVPIAPVETIVVIKLLVGRHQDLGDIEAIIESGADRDRLREAVRTSLPDRLDDLERLFDNVDRSR